MLPKAYHMKHGRVSKEYPRTWTSTGLDRIKLD